MFISARFSRHRRKLIGLGVAVLSTITGPQLAGAQAAADTAALGALRAENARLEARVDSMRQELRDHRFAENFVSDALEDQGNRFALIVTIALGLTALITVGGFLWEMNRAKQEVRDIIDNQKRENAAMQAQLTEAQRLNTVAMEARQAEHDLFMRRAAGNAYVAIATIYENSSPGLALAAWLLAAGNFYAAQAGPDERGGSLGAVCLDNALDTLSGISPAERQKVAGELARAERLCTEAFDLLHNSAGRETADKVAVIRVGIQNLIPAPAPGARPGAEGLLPAGENR